MTTRAPASTAEVLREQGVASHTGMLSLLRRLAAETGFVLTVTSPSGEIFLRAGERTCAHPGGFAEAFAATSVARSTTLVHDGMTMAYLSDLGGAERALFVAVGPSPQPHSHLSRMSRIAGTVKSHWRSEKARPGEFSAREAETRNREADRHLRLTRRERSPRDPATLVSVEGHAWAAKLLAPVEHYRARRRSDPDARELTETLRRWLTAPEQVMREGYIHRNTRTRRIRQLDALLNMDLNALHVQATLALALRMRELAGQGIPESTRDGELVSPLESTEVRDWASEYLRPLTGTALPAYALPTVRTWLAHDAVSVRSAGALGISATALRKRLTRIGKALDVPILHERRARYDLWLAMAVHDKVTVSKEAPAL